MLIPIVRLFESFEPGMRLSPGDVLIALYEKGLKPQAALLERPELEESASILLPGAITLVRKMGGIPPLNYVLYVTLLSEGISQSVPFWGNILGPKTYIAVSGRDDLLGAGAFPSNWDVAYELGLSQAPVITSTEPDKHFAILQE